MDEIDEKILRRLRGNARMTYQELGGQLGISRVAAMKRVKKLEKAGIIRGYNTTIYREGDIMIFIDIVTLPGRIDAVLDYLGTRTAYIRQIYKTTKENHIHAVAVSDSGKNLQYLVRMIQKKCGDDIEELHCHAVTEIIKDVYGGVRYERKEDRESAEDNEQHGGSGSS